MDDDEVFTGTTVQLILREAARLFSAKGFAGTSTREIADAVGIRQPSLFHHFASKIAIAQALFEYDYQRSPWLRGEPELVDEPPPVRLFHALRREVEVEMTSLFDLRGLYLTSVIREPEFAKWAAAYDDSLARITALVREGIESQDFIAADPLLVTEIVDAVVNQAVRWGPEKHAGDPNAVAALVLRMILRRPSRVASIRTAADRALVKDSETRLGA